VTGAGRDHDRASDVGRVVAAIVDRGQWRQEVVVRLLGQTDRVRLVGLVVPAATATRVDDWKPVRSVEPKRSVGNLICSRLNRRGSDKVHGPREGKSPGSILHDIELYLSPGRDLRSAQNTRTRHVATERNGKSRICRIWRGSGKRKSHRRRARNRFDDKCPAATAARGKDRRTCL